MYLYSSCTRKYFYQKIQNNTAFSLSERNLKNIEESLTKKIDDSSLKM